LRDQCQSAKVPFFFKQWGSGYRKESLDARKQASDAGWLPEAYSNKGGHLLDGKEYREFPK